jgi:two-component system sensor histidine kinase DegS
VRKHSQATKVLVQLNFSERDVKVTIHDNGVGFEMPAKVGDFTRIGKLGLVGIQERTQLLSGKLSVETKPGKGTILIVELPF